MRELSGIVVLVLAVVVAAWELWKLYGPKKRARGMKIRLRDDEH